MVIDRKNSDCYRLNRETPAAGRMNEQMSRYIPLNLQRLVFTNLFLTDVCIDLLTELVSSGSGGVPSFTCEAVVQTYPLLTTHAESKH